MERIILPLAYLGPVQYFSKFYAAERIIIEQHDHYRKQSYRNRCRILAANGVLDLSIPVVKRSGVKAKVKDVRIDYAVNWQHNHWHSICSAYNSSPFFEYFSDELAPFYEKKFSFLLDYNLDLIRLLLDQLQHETDILLSEDFFKAGSGLDYREMISPKVSHEEDSNFRILPYYQTFTDKKGFQPNLSILDLLCNEGPNAGQILKDSFLHQP